MQRSPSSAGPRPPTIKDIARALGVSVAAVSHTLSGANGSTTRISPETAALIRETAKRMNYRKSAGAVDLRQRTVRRVAVIGEKFVGGYAMMVRMTALLGLQEYLLNRGYTLDIIQEPAVDLPTDHVPGYISTHSHAGLVLYSRSRHHDERLVSAFEAHRIPWVVMDGTPGQANTISLDEYNAGHVATRHLLELGHRRIAYVGYDLDRTTQILDGRLPEGHFSRELPSGRDAEKLIASPVELGSAMHDDEIKRLKQMISGPLSHGLKTTQKSDVTRFRGYEAAMAAAGLPVQGFSWVPNSPLVAEWRNRARDLEVPELRTRFTDFVRRDTPTALVCYNDAFAWTTIQLLREAAIDVPRQVSVVGINNLPATNFCSPELTTVTLHYSDLGLHAGQMLIASIESPIAIPAGRTMPCSLHLRRSTAPHRG